MNFNFELILFYAIIICGIILLLDKIFLNKWLTKNHNFKKIAMVVEYAGSFFPILCIVFLLRSFLFEPFRIPTGSLEPSLLTGDFILVNKYDYGIRLPVSHTKLFNYHTPRRGDIMVFRWPPAPNYNFIKRVIGIPGDKISYIDKTLYINDKKVPQTLIKQETYTDAENNADNENNWTRKLWSENLLGINHNIYTNTARESHDFRDIIVPEHYYFVMGDNRDDSVDSRYWGFVPEANIVGKAVLVWLSWDKINSRIRFNRMGNIVN